MKATFCACAVALAMTILLPTSSVTYANDIAAPAALSQSSTNINIDRIKSVLQLTAEQQRYWPAIETALRSLAREQARPEPSGFVSRMKRKVVSVVLNGAAIERLASAVRPLVAMLSQEQMQSASGLAQEMGLGPVVMAALR